MEYLLCTQTIGVMENSKVNKVKKLVFWGKGGQTYAQIIIVLVEYSEYIIIEV